MTPRGRRPHGRCSSGRCRSCGRTAAASRCSRASCCSQIALGALQPWPLKVVIDYVLVGQPMPEPYRAVAASRRYRQHRWRCSSRSSCSGVVLQMLNQFVSAYGTQVQVDTGQRMVYDLRDRLFQHLQALGLHHHITTSTGDAVYRVDVDAYSIENLVMSGIFPLATSIATLMVMFVDPAAARRHRRAAVAGGRAVPVPRLRYYTSTLVDREERVKELESKLLERLYETFSARSGWSRASRASRTSSSAMRPPATRP